MDVGGAGCVQRISSALIGLRAVPAILCDRGLEITLQLWLQLSAKAGEKIVVVAFLYLPLELVDGHNPAHKYEGLLSRFKGTREASDHLVHFGMRYFRAKAFPIAPDKIVHRPHIDTQPLVKAFGLVGIVERACLFATLFFLADLGGLQETFIVQCD